MKKPSSTKQSAGTLLYRTTERGLEVLLVHPSGNYNRHKPWSIPKGVPDEGEDLEAAARRETLEECDVVAGELEYLGRVVYHKSRKTVHCFAGRAPGQVLPRCASWEVDCAEFVPLEAARQNLHPDQLPFLELLAGKIGNSEQT
jgi:predicted NUDIX family NTP pyrophosphohydrolase